LEILKLFDGNIPSLLVMGIFFLGTTLVNNGYLSKFLKSKGKDSSEGKEGKGQSIADLIERIEREVAKLSRRVGHTDKSALMAIIYSPAIHVIDRLRAFDCYLRLGGNGFVAEFAITELIVPHKNEWLRVQHENTMDIYCEKYHERIAEIRKRINEAA
jgi:hypothetical protein